MYTFQFQDGSWRIDIMTSSKQHYPAYGSLEHKLFEGVYLNRRDAEQAIERIRMMEPKR